MKRLLSYCLFFVFSVASAQSTRSDIVGAEKSFAAAARASGTRDAFLAYLDSSAEVFEKGGFVNGIQSWQSRPKRPGLLAWYPQFAEIAASGDFGYTTGPWTFQAGPTDSIVARGQYHTVWHRTPDGWKFLVDIGIGYSFVNEAREALTTVISTNDQSRDTITAWWAEKRLIQRIQNESTGESGVLSSRSIVSRAGRLPAFTPETRQTALAGLPADLVLVPTGTGTASSGDIAYVYGIATSGGKSEAYLHTWRREGLAWKLALDVIPF
jgi:ketosteroid isomerase-like protein